MPLPVPEIPDNTPQIFANNKILRYNQVEANIIAEYVGGYEDFWGVQWPPRGSRHTTAEMQDIINRMPQSAALTIIKRAEVFVQTYGTGLDERYHTPAFVVTIHNGSTIVVGDLKSAWQEPVEAIESEAV
jgi:hypothetical protein